MQIILLLLFLSGTLTQSPACSDLFDSILGSALSQDYATLLKETSQYIQFSGKGANKFGDYDACMRNPQMKYYDLIALTPIGYQMIGVCISSQCSADDVEKLMPNVKELIFSLTGLDLRQLQTTVNDPEIYKENIGAGTYLTCITCVLLFFLTLIKPAMDIVTALKAPRQPTNPNNINQSVGSGYNESNAEIPEEVPKAPQTLMAELTDTFSIVTNWHELLKCDTPDPSLSIFNGFRVIAFMMVVFGHQFAIAQLLIDYQELMIQLPSWLAFFLFDCFCSVDIFFWIGGFFLGFVVIDSKRQAQVRRAGIGAFAWMVGHRVLRIWPCYILVMCVLKYVIPFVGGGARWFYIYGTTNCPNFWRNVLFIQVLGEHEECMGWAWYLSNDMLLFLASLVPLYLYVQFKQEFWGKVLIFLMLVTSQTIGTVITFQSNYSVFFWTMYDPQLRSKMMSNYYQEPWCRGAPYFLGLLFGVMYREMKNHKAKVAINPNTEEEFVPWMWNARTWVFVSKARIIGTMIVLYAVGAGLFFGVMFGWRPEQQDKNAFSPTLQHLWFAFDRLVIVFSLSIIAFIGAIGIKDTFNTQIMSNYGFRFIAKISFTCYLVHYFIITITLSDFYEAPNFTFFDQIQYFIGNCVITFAVAIILTLTVEMPFGKLEKRFTTPRRTDMNQIYNKV